MDLHGSAGPCKSMIRPWSCKIHWPPFTKHYRPAHVIMALIRWPGVAGHSISRLLLHVEELCLVNRHDLLKEFVILLGWETNQKLCRTWKNGCPRAAFTKQHHTTSCNQHNSLWSGWHIVLTNIAPKMSVYLVTLERSSGIIVILWSLKTVGSHKFLQV